MQENALLDPRTSGCLWFYRDLATARKHFETGPHLFAGGMNPFAVAVPSVIVPVWNVVLYPNAHRFWDHVALESVDAFEFDPRLFRDSTSVEASER